MKRFFILMVLSSIILSCSSNSEPEIVIIDPDVITGSAIVGTSGGVTFEGSAEFNGNNIISFGFEYALNEAITSNKETIEASGDESQFISTITNNLQTGVEYFFRAYVRNEENINFYGEVKNFVSSGSIPPEIYSLSSEYGYMGDEIQINGKYFGDNQIAIVDFGGNLASITSSNDSIIRCVVPNTLTQFNNDVNVRVDGKETSYSSFKLHAPVINDVQPIQSFFGDEILIIGDHFDTDITKNIVTFDLSLAEIISASRNELRIKIPIEIDKQSTPLRVIANFQYVTYSDNFILHPPKILNAPASAETNEVIELSGEYFHPILSMNTVFFEGVEAEVISGNTESLMVKVPLGPFPERNAAIRIEVLDMEDEYQTKIEISDDWVMISNSLPFRFNRAIRNPMVVNNQAYILSFSDDITDEEIYLWKFNETDFTWERESIPFQMDAFGISVTNGNKIYVYTAESNNDFWEYDPTVGSWTQKQDYIGARRDGATIFSIGNDVYMGMGVDFEPYTSLKYGDFYKYSPSSDSWSPIANFTYNNYFLRIETSTFVINNIAYVGNGASNTGMNDFWSYNPSSNQWTRIANFPDARGYTAAFTINNKGYVTGGTPVGSSNYKDCWEYDPSLDTWLRISDIGRIERAGHFTFVLNDKVYLGGGGVTNSGGSSGYDFYQFIP